MKNKNKKNNNKPFRTSECINWVLKKDLFNMTHTLNVMLQPLAIDAKNSPIGWILDLHRTVGKYLFHYKWTSPSRSQFTGVQVQARIIQMHFLIWLKVFSQDLFIVSDFQFRFINPGIVICIVSQLLNFGQLEFAIDTCGIQIKV